MKFRGPPPKHSDGLTLFVQYLIPLLIDGCCSIAVILLWEESRIGRFAKGHCMIMNPVDELNLLL